MMKCSFCEQPLVCNTCGKPFQPRRGETHLGVYQADTAVSCPECHALLVCRGCGYAYGEDEQKEE
ncbi:MAG TPA: hypothetical protein VFA18_20315 [Gemmataceae bacterium]|nr:hypothetical protein [Gemmataceae bacterium]